LKFAERP
jgi:hypothetical protein